MRAETGLEPATSWLWATRATNCATLLKIRFIDTPNRATHAHAQGAAKPGCVSPRADKVARPIKTAARATGEEPCATPRARASSSSATCACSKSKKAPRDFSCCDSRLPRFPLEQILGAMRLQQLARIRAAIRIATQRRKPARLRVHEFHKLRWQRQRDAQKGRALLVSFRESGRHKIKSHRCYSLWTGQQFTMHTESYLITRRPLNVIHFLLLTQYDSL
jgi:hypothetical protein